MSQKSNYTDGNPSLSGWLWQDIMGEHRQHHPAADALAHNAVPRFITPTNRVLPYGPYVSTSHTSKFGFWFLHLIITAHTCSYAQTLWHDYSRVPASNFDAALPIPIGFPTTIGFPIGIGFTHPTPACQFGA